MFACAAELSVEVHSAFAAQGHSCMCLKDDLFIQLQICGMPFDW